MRKWKIAAIAVLTCLLSLVCVIAASCGKTDETGSSAGGEQTKKEYLALNAYTVTLYVGETFEIFPKKYDETGVEQQIEKVKYLSEFEKVATVKDGLITAVGTGTTNIQIDVDGLESVCFVTVEFGSREEGLTIEFVEEVLYMNIPARAYVYATKGGESVRVTQGITWSVDDGETLSVTEDGLVTALKLTSGALLKANLTYDGKEYSLQRSIPVEEPTVYWATYSTLTLAAPFTLTGEENTKYTEAQIKIEEYNPITTQKSMVSSERLTVQVLQEDLLEVKKETDNVLTICAKQVGMTRVVVVVDGKKNVPVIVDVAYAMSSIADMDQLALASNNASHLLSKSYMLVSDIDYAGEIIYPIAAYMEHATLTSVGIQWKYLLETTGGTSVVDSIIYPEYKFVDRELVGALKDGEEVCYGLSDDEFKTLAFANGINPKNLSFTGKFDGNGYAIKNAKTMYDIFLMNVSASTLPNKRYGSYSSIFGKISGATIKNIAFENISMQLLNDFVAEDNANGLNRHFVKGAIVSESTIEEGGVDSAYRGFGIIARSMDSTVSNVFVDADVSETKKIYYELINGILQICATNSITSNCVVVVRGETRANTRALGGASSQNGGVFVNNLAIGVVHAETKLENGQQGQNGNYWCKDESFAALYETQIGANAMNAQTMSAVVASYNDTIWDMSEFISKTGAPKLKQGCSILA